LTLAPWRLPISSSGGRTARAISWLWRAARAIDEVDLQIALLRQLPEIVLPDEAVEVDGRRRAA